MFTNTIVGLALLVARHFSRLERRCLAQSQPRATRSENGKWNCHTKDWDVLHAPGQRGTDRALSCPRRPYQVLPSGSHPRCLLSRALASDRFEARREREMEGERERRPECCKWALFECMWCDPGVDGLFKVLLPALSQRRERGRDIVSNQPGHKASQENWEPTVLGK